MQVTFPAIEPVFTRRLYLAGLEELATEVARVDEQTETLLVLGHNPGFSFVVHWLSGEHVDLKAADAALLEIEDSGGWSSVISRRDWKLVDLVRARGLS